MNLHRRSFLGTLLSVSATLLCPSLLFAARPDKAFSATSPDDALSELFGATPEASDAVSMKIPDIAENGAVVPVSVTTSLDDVESISVIVDNNPTPLAASFTLSARTPADVSVRIKMGESSMVRAVVKAGGQLYETTKEVKVTIGGCGG